MKKFTVKDFIAYNNPCFSCGSPINFNVHYVGNPVVGKTSRPLITPNYIEIDLKIAYSRMEALKLCVFHKTNKILTNSIEGLTKYVTENKLYLESRCDKCGTSIESQFLEINIDKGYVVPVEIRREILSVISNDRIYQIKSSFAEGKSRLIVDRIDKVGPMSPCILEMPLLPKYRFKDREHFINKIKTYVIFS
jgi:hypothetical protein